MFKVLAEFMRAGDDLALRNPLFQILDLAIQLVQLENFTELVTPLER